MAKKHFTLYLEPETIEKLTKLAAKERRAVAEMGRIIIEDALAKRRP